ncbi:DUF1996 domain-containing protein [Streptomyces sp. NPDC100445]|uniref:DUF1996 domain-containing protein n=1 Tax=Streptomyces sp. NPDC100445 TaxID=3366102 RepID=UPI0037F1A0B4
MLGGTGLAAANVYASADEGWGDGSGTGTTARVLSTGMATIDCPDVGSRLTAVPAAARPDVDRELALLDQRTAAAYRRLQQGGQGGTGTTADAVTGPLKGERSASIGRITDALARAGEHPRGLDGLAACTLRPGDTGSPTAAPSGTGQEQGGTGQGQNGAGQAGNGPVVSDYADITAVQPDAPAPPLGPDASRGTFTSDCGVNANGLFNSDNVIVAPGVSNGAHHFHDYVGNQGNNAFAGDDDLAKAATSCVDQGDRSTYYWPVLRLQNGRQERDAGAPGGGTEGNAGQIVTPAAVTLTFVGNPRGKVTAMPRLLRIITGDAKAFVNGPGNANASWSCTGYENRQLKDKYPLCPRGSDVVRTFRFQSCWDGRNIDSANHRTHVAFATVDGSCPAGFRPIPQLVQRIVYDVAAPSLVDGGRTVPLFAVDSFPEQLHKPVTDHGDFINVFDEDLMRRMVDCINSGRSCRPSGGHGDDGGKGGGAGGAGTATATPTATSRPEATVTPGGPASAEPGPAATTRPGGDAATEPGPGATSAPGTGATSVPRPSASRTAAVSRTEATTAPARTPAPSATSGRDGADKAAPTGAAPPSATPSLTAPPASAPAPAPVSVSSAPASAQATAAGYLPPVAGQTRPQASGGRLAETGARLWPAALGTLLALSGLFMLIRARRLPH